MSKSVIRKNSSAIVGHEPMMRTQIMKEVTAHRYAGPFTSCPFKSPRSCPLSMIPKNKHDPESNEWRILSDFSAGRGVRDRSVNDLCFNPCLISAHAGAHTIRDRIALLGPGCCVDASDVLKCFRTMSLREDLLSLFVYHLDTSERGREWFVDLCCPFGWRPSEYSWQCVLAIILWELRRRGTTDIVAYVDNFFQFYPSLEARSAGMKSFDVLCAEANIPLHERQGPFIFKGLGWHWDLHAMTMACPEEKRTTFMRSGIFGSGLAVPSR
jgi:hypothetical protein